MNGDEVRAPTWADVGCGLVEVGIATAEAVADVDPDRWAGVHAQRAAAHLDQTARQAREWGADEARPAMCAAAALLRIAAAADQRRAAAKEARLADLRSRPRSTWSREDDAWARYHGLVED